MRDSNNERESINSLKTEVAVLRNELEHIKQRDKWVQTIMGTLIVGILVWLCQRVVSPL